jgi:hypothetical protein
MRSLLIKRSKEVESKLAKKLVITNVSCEIKGLEVHLSDYETREEAEQALHEQVLENLDYGFEEVEC